jgi:tetratricopeptide (TPR) repeat protein
VRSLLIAPLLALAFSFPAVAQDNGSSQTNQQPERTPAQREANQELNEAARCYHEGDFAAAQQHSEIALLLDPASRTAPLFIARTIHAQYRPGIQSEANVAKANDAIAAYKRILLQDPRSEESYKAIAYLYGATKQNELQRQWVLQRALDPNVSTKKRSEAYVVLASKDWDCSFKITELPTNKTVTESTRKPFVHYQKPKDPAEFENAQRCAAEGLEFVEAAISLDPESESAWSYKTNLLIEMSKLAEMDHKLRLKAEYDRQMKEAESKTRELSERKQNPPTKP